MAETLDHLRRVEIELARAKQSKDRKRIAAAKAQLELIASQVEHPSLSPSALADEVRADEADAATSEEPGDAA